MNWFDYPICVPFGNPNYDARYGGSHDMDIRTPPNTPITSLVDGKITDISAPIWGKQVCLQIGGFTAPYTALLHLAATEPSLSIGKQVHYGDLIGWSGGCTDDSQYAGTSNPTGENFLNASSQSSQPQTGIALMYGPVYGSGDGWKIFPPVDWTLDPLPVLAAARARALALGDQLTSLNQIWCAVIPNMRYPTGIYDDWLAKAKAGECYGPPITSELDGQVTSSGGATCKRQFFTAGWCEDRGGKHVWYKYA
jgi:hypothetical protein